MKTSLVALTAVAVCLGGATVAHAQQVQGEATVTVGQPPQGTVYVQPQQPYQQPYGYPQQQPPPGYYPQQQPQQQYYPPQPAQPAQPRYVERSQSITGLWVSGVILLPVSWVLTWTSASLTQDSYRDIDYFLFSWIPVAGPWFMLGQNDTRALNESEVAGALLAGVAQATGLLLIILGVALRRTVRVPVYALDDSERAPQLSFNVLPAPGAGAQLGVTLTHF